MRRKGFGPLVPDWKFLPRNPHGALFHKERAGGAAVTGVSENEGPSR